MVWFSTVRVVKCQTMSVFPWWVCKNAQSHREQLQMEFSFSFPLQGVPKMQSEMDGERNLFHFWQQLQRGISDSGAVIKRAICSSMNLRTGMWLAGTFHMPVLTAWEGDLNFLDSHLTPMNPQQPWGSCSMAWWRSCVSISLYPLPSPWWHLRAWPGCAGEGHHVTALVTRCL